MKIIISIHFVLCLTLVGCAALETKTYPYVIDDLDIQVVRTGCLIVGISVVNNRSTTIDEGYVTVYALDADRRTVMDAICSLGHMESGGIGEFECLAGGSFIDPNFKLACAHWKEIGVKASAY